MTDIVRRLREPPFGTETSERNLMIAAADEITRLRAEVEKLRAAITRQANAVRTLEHCKEAEVNILRQTHHQAHVATKTLESEREANAILTDENERLRAALRGVVRVADRDTAEFNEARVALEEK